MQNGSKQPEQVANKNARIKIRAAIVSTAARKVAGVVRVRLRIVRASPEREMRPTFLVMPAKWSVIL